MTPLETTIIEGLEEFTEALEHGVIGGFPQTSIHSSYWDRLTGDEPKIIYGTRRPMPSKPPPDEAPR